MLVVLDPRLPQLVVDISRFLQRLVPRLPRDVPSIVLLGVLRGTHHVDDRIVPLIAQIVHVIDLQLFKHSLPVLRRHEG